MSSYEDHPGAEGLETSAIEVMQEHARWFEEYVRTHAEIDTVADYRICRPRLQRHAKRLFEAQELAGEPAAVQISGTDCATIIDYSTNQRHPAGDIVAGYVASYYVAAQPCDVGSFMRGIESPHDLERYAMDTVSRAGWRDEDNPVDIALGVRFKPVLTPFGCNAQTTYIEVPIKYIDAMYEMEESHPLTLEASIFTRQAELLLQQVHDRPESKHAQEAKISELTKWMSETTRLKDYRMELSLYDAVPYIPGDDLAAYRSFLGSDEEVHETLEIRLTGAEGLTVEAFLKGFDWRWDQADDEEDDVEPLLYATLELTDEDDSVRFGNSIITVPVDGIRFGVCYPTGLHTDKPSVSQNALSYETELFSRYVEYFETLADEEVRHQEVRSFLKLVNNQRGSRVLNSPVAIRLDHDRVLGARLVDYTGEYIESVLLPEWYECSGVVREFLVRDVGESDDFIILDMLAVLDVSEDRYFKSLDIAYIEVPLQAVERAAFLPGPHAS